MGALLCVRRTRTSLGRAVPYVPRTVAPQARVITGDGDKTREAVATVGTLVTALSGDLAGVAGQISSIQTTATPYSWAASRRRRCARRARPS